VPVHDFVQILEDIAEENLGQQLDQRMPKLSWTKRSLAL
jgi:hypothetical protein